MYLLPTGAVVTSASDLTTASKCEFAFLRALDAKLGKIEAVEEPEDSMLERAARLGDEHERKVLARYKAAMRVVELERPPIAEVQRAADETKAAFASDAEVVFQTAFYDGSFLGYADFIVRQEDGTWEVQDSKLARSAKVTALLQLAAYAEQLTKIGVTPSSTVRLLLGDGSESAHELRDILPVYRNRRAHLDALSGTAQKMPSRSSGTQGTANLMHSPALTDYSPPTPKGVAELSAFIELVEA